MCNIKGTDPSPPKFARNFAAGFIGAVLSPIDFSKLRSAIGNFVFQCEGLLQKCFPNNSGNAFTDAI